MSGLGAVLLQRGKPIASKGKPSGNRCRDALLYVQIEKECLAVVNGLEKFHVLTPT